MPPELSPSSPSPDPEGQVSRRRFLVSAGVAGGAAVVGGASAGLLLGVRGSAAPTAAEKEIFRFALSLERLQAAYYAEAVAQGELPPNLLEFAETASEHEGAHIEALLEFIEEDPPEEPPYDFGDVTTDPARFAETAVRLEDLGVSAYNGQIGNLKGQARLLAGRIASVDGRHAAWIRSLRGDTPAPRPVDVGRDAAAVRAAVERTGLVGG